MAALLTTEGFSLCFCSTLEWTDGKKSSNLKLEWLHNLHLK